MPVYLKPGVYLWTPLLFLVALCLSTHALGDSREFTWLERFPNSDLEQVDQKQVPEYRLLLGQLRIISKQIRSEEERLSGQLTRLTYRIPSGHSSRAAYEHFLAQLKTLGAEILFTCSSRDCGRSSEWATDVFGIANLYGVEREQNYLAARLVRDGKQYYIALYTIMRGNQRVYAHLDVIKTGEADEAAADPARTPGVVLPIRDSDFAVSFPETLRDFVERARKVPEQAVWIVLHTNGSSFTEATQRSEPFGNRLKLWLVSRGIAEQRIRTLSVGPLASAHNPAVPRERAELFLLTE